MALSIPYVQWLDFDVGKLAFHLDKGAKGGPRVKLTYAGGPLGIVSPAAVTQYPRCTGDGNLGANFGPASGKVEDAKFELDLWDLPVKDGEPNLAFLEFKTKLDLIDAALCAFVTEHQTALLGRKNLSGAEVKMLQNCAVKARYDKLTNEFQNHFFSARSGVYPYDGGVRYRKTINICDCTGKVLPQGEVCKGDVVMATLVANCVYTLGSGSFGISWGFDDVCVVAQRSALAVKTEVPQFMDAILPQGLAKPYSTKRKLPDQFNDDPQFDEDGPIVYR